MSDIKNQEFIYKHMKLEINFEDFFLIKFLIWRLLTNLNCQFLTVYKAICLLEKYRYLMAVELSKV